MKQTSKIIAFVIAFVLFINASVLSLQTSAEAATTEATESVPDCNNLSPELLTTGTSYNTKGTVTFYAKAEGMHVLSVGATLEAVCGTIGNIIYPSDSGLYRNNVKNNNLQLHVLAEGRTTGEKQFYISLDTDAANGDVVTIKGQFKHGDIVLEFVETSFVWDANQSTWRTITSVTYNNLDAILYTGSQTSKTCKSSVSFHVDTSGIGTIPLNETYTPTSQDVENGIYRNGEIEKELYLYTYYPGTDTMQFYIGLDKAESAGASERDVIKIRGQFAYLDISTGKQYVLCFNECEFVCKTVSTSSTIAQDGYDWVAVAKPDFKNLQPKHFAGSSTYNTASYVSFSVTADELYTITQLGGSDWETFSAVRGTQSGILYGEESGIYKNGQQLENVRLWAVDPINKNASVQFIIDLGNNVVTAGDMIMLTGQFKYSNCLLEFDKAAFEYLGGTGGSSWKDAEGITIESFKQMFNQYDSDAERWDLYFYLNGTIAGATENAHYNNLKVEVINPQGISTINNVDAYWISGNVLFIPLTKAAWGVTEDLSGYQIIVKSWCGVNDEANSWIYLEEDYCLSINTKGWSSNGFIVDAKANVSDIDITVRSGLGDERGIYFTDKNDKMANFTQSWEDTYYAKFGPQKNLRYPTKSGVYINGIRNADVGVRWTSEGFYLLLAETGGYTAIEGDVITIQGFFKYDDTSFELNEYAVQYRNNTWTEESLKVITHVGENTSEIKPGIMSEYILPEVPEGYDGWMIEGDSCTFYDAGDSLPLINDVELRAYKLQDGDCNNDGSTDVRDLVRIYKYKNDSSSVAIHTFNADLNASGCVDFEETNGDEQMLRSLLITDEVIDYNLTAYKNDDVIEFSAYQGPRRAGTFGDVTCDVSYITQEQFLQYKEAGFDYLISEQDAAYGCKVHKADDGTYVVKGGYSFADSDLCDYMNLAEGVGLDVVVLSHEINAAISGNTDEDGKAFIRQMLVDLLQYDCFKGIMLTDEPSYAQAEQYKKIYNLVMEIAEELAPERQLYLLATKLPMYATVEALTGSGGSTISNNKQHYQKYMEAFAETEDNFMYDFYPLMHRERSTWSGDYIQKTWFSNLQTVAENSDTFGIVLQSCGFRGDSASYVYNRDLNEQDDIDWQVNTSLAFGVREISYYSYWRHWGSDKIQHTGMMVDKTGTKTSVYDYVQRANDILKKFDHVLAKFNWKGTAKYWANANLCFNSTNSLASTQLMEFNDYSLTGGVTASVSGTVALIGEFQDDLGTMAYYVTNAAAPEMDKSGVVSMNFGDDVKGAVIYHNGIKSYMRLAGGSMSIEIASGEGVFVIPMQ